MCSIPNGFFERLEQLYKQGENTREYWGNEGDSLKQIIPEVAKELAFNYKLELPIAVGGGGVVIAVHDKNLEATRALKISRPAPGKEQLLAKVLLSETQHLRRLSHHNLIRIFAQGVVRKEDTEHPYYVMEYVKGAQDSDKFLAAPSRTREDVLRVFEGILAAVQYLHSEDTIHMDLKPANILVTPVGIPIVSDLGFAKRITLDGGYTQIGGTEGFIHPEARKLVEEAASDPNRLKGEAIRTDLKLQWDLYSLGKTFLRLLLVLETANPKILSIYDKRYLRLMACRLLDGYNADDERAIGLSTTALKELKYERASEAAVDLDKLTGKIDLASRVPELNQYYEDTLQISTVAPTAFTPRVRELLTHPILMRLARVTQLGLLYLVYPTARHTRLEHTVGTFSILGSVVKALYYDPFNPLFRQIMTEDDIRAVLLCALLHDVGHYPLAHDIEEADPNLSHEQLGYDMIRNNEKGIRDLIRRPDGWSVDPDRVTAILKADVAALSGTIKDRILHSLLDGPIDTDKMDYLTRDSVHTGLPYGKGIDLFWLLRCLTVVFRDKNGNTYASLGIHEKGKVPAEAIAFARYAMFGQVYWHHTNRAAKAMIHRLVWEMLSRVESERDRTRVRDEFRRFVRGIVVPRQTQRDLFQEEEPVAWGTETGSVRREDLAVLAWIAERAGQSGSELKELLATRRVFKRILVLAHEKVVDKELWDDISNFYRANHRRWRRKLRLQKEFQARIVRRVEERLAPSAETMVVTPDARNGFIARGHEQPILLVDFPPEKKGTKTALEYIVEEDRRRYKIDEMRTGSLEQSIVWKGLQDSFHESIGKLRIFCHPDHAEFVSAYLSRQEFEAALREALAETDRD